MCRWQPGNFSCFLCELLWHLEHRALNKPMAYLKLSFAQNQDMQFYYDKLFVCWHSKPCDQGSPILVLCGKKVRL